MAMTIADYEQNGSDAEKELIKACRAGLTLELGELPPENGPAHTVRADLIRTLAVQATSLHETGVWLEGARITGVLDLRFAKCRGRLVLDKCRFEQGLLLERAELGTLSLEQSSLFDLFAQGANLAGDLFLRSAQATSTIDICGVRIGGQLDCTGANLNGNGNKALNAQGLRVKDSLLFNDVTATGTVDLTGAQIGGQFDCVGATLDGNGGPSLNARRIRVKASSLLRKLTATGTLAFTGAQIGGQLACVGSDLNGYGSGALDGQGARVTADFVLDSTTATGTVDLNGARIGGQFLCRGATLNGNGEMALNGQSLSVEEGFVFLNVASVRGEIGLTSARVGDLVDDGTSWAKCAAVVLSGFTYDRISGNTSPKTFDHRKEWLEKGSHFDGEFFPQPYTQFAKVMRASGHLGEARKALMARDTILFREAEKADRDLLAKIAPSTWSLRLERSKIRFRLQRRRLWAGLSRRVIGHGHKPERALLWAIGAWGFGALVYFWAYRVGLMVPNSDVIMVSSEWLVAVKANADAPTAAWTQDTVLASKHYESFFAAIYALDLFLPIVDLGQESTWAVTTPTTFGWGWWLRVGTLLYQIAGWVIVSLGIAAVTGFVQRNDPE